MELYLCTKLILVQRKDRELMDGAVSAPQVESVLKRPGEIELTNKAH